MKKFLLLISACLMGAMNAWAQNTPSEKTDNSIVAQPELETVVESSRYQGEFNAGYETLQTYFLETIHGVRVNKNLFVGIGVGLHYIDKSGIKVGDGENRVDFCKEGRLPIFLNLKGYIPVNDKLAPYINLSMGYGIGKDYGGGLYCDFGAGLKYRLLNFGLGLSHHANHYDQVGPTFGYNAFHVKIGLCW